MKKMFYCPRCEQTFDLEEESRFCPACGAEVKQTHIYPSEWSEMSAGSKELKLADLKEKYPYKEKKEQREDTGSSLTAITILLVIIIVLQVLAMTPNSLFAALGGWI